MSNRTLQFVIKRVETLVHQARLYPHTCPMVRGYLNRVFKYALRLREPELMEFVCEQEKRIV